MKKIKETFRKCKKYLIKHFKISFWGPFQALQAGLTQKGLKSQKNENFFFSSFWVTQDVLLRRGHDPRGGRGGPGGQSPAQSTSTSSSSSSSTALSLSPLVWVVQKKTKTACENIVQKFRAGKIEIVCVQKFICTIY